MKKILKILPIFYIFFPINPLFHYTIIPSFSQNLTFQRTYSAGIYTFGRDIKQIADGGYIVLGNTGGFAGNTDIYLFKIDSIGDIIWERIIGGIGVDWGNTIEITADCGYIIGGYTNTSGQGGYDMYLVKTDSLGNVLWSKTFGGDDWDFGYSAVQTADGGFAIVGETYSNTNGANDVFLVKTDNNGNTLWTKTFGGTDSDFAKDVQLCSDNGLVIVGGTNSFGAGGYDVYVIKTNEYGDTLWTKTYGDTLDDYGNAIEQTNDTGFIICGYGSGYDTIDAGYLLKLDSYGDSLWSKMYFTGGAYYSIIQNNNTDYVLVGYTVLFGGGGKDIHLIILNSNGDFLFGPTFGALQTEEAYSIQPTFDKGYIFIGNTESWGFGIISLYLVKIDSLFQYSDTVINIQNIQEINFDNSGILIYPNPFSNTTNLRIMNFSEYTNYELRIYNLLGREMLFDIIRNSDGFLISRNGLPTGLYICKISDSQCNIFCKKIIIQ